MKAKFLIVVFYLILTSCKTKLNANLNLNDSSDLVIAFGSCNNQKLENKLWKEVIKHNPNAWIWGGDNIYSDTDDATKMKADYETVLNNEDYKTLGENSKIMATWDDHDYGLNDGGEEFHFKKESQQLFLDFLGVSKTDERRTREGVYYSETITSSKGNVNVIVLDTRYFRSPLIDAADSKKRYQPNIYGKGTLLGEQQWLWLTSELQNSKADFNIIVSSIQYLSGEHGFETWGNFPHEVDKLKQIITSANAKGVLLLSGDRHISEFSKEVVQGLKYPLIDFTSSGLTHAYKGFKSEPNKFREGFVISDISFGLLKFNFKNNTIQMQMRGEDNRLQQELIQAY